MRFCFGTGASDNLTMTANDKNRKNARSELVSSLAVAPANMKFRSCRRNLSCAALDPEKYEVVEIGITKSGQWLTGDAMTQLSAGEIGACPATLLPDPESVGACCSWQPEMTSLPVCQKYHRLM